jgi:hypothetical protein
METEEIDFFIDEKKAQGVKQDLRCSSQKARGHVFGVHSDPSFS